MDIKIQKELGKKLKTAREKSGLTQEEVAKIAKISSNYYAKIERGEINTTLEKLYKIIKALKIDASEIFPS
ncbi:MAG TPA: helix-turn-helix transcriptional regulator [Candidatus Limnocylindrales bacterium]|nr:helix-turn-helix transcriptional regulator [Candidatus Limnocylindrales bacterium]